MPHVVQFSSFVFSFEICFGDVLELLSWFVACELDGSSTVLRDGLFVGVVVVGEGDSVGII